MNVVVVSIVYRKSDNQTRTVLTDIKPNQTKNIRWNEKVQKINSHWNWNLMAANEKNEREREWKNFDAYQMFRLLHRAHFFCCAPVRSKMRRQCNWHILQTNFKLDSHNLKIQILNNALNFFAIPLYLSICLCLSYFSHVFNVASSAVSTVFRGIFFFLSRKSLNWTWQWQLLW